MAELKKFMFDNFIISPIQKEEAVDQSVFQASQDEFVIATQEPVAENKQNPIPQTTINQQELEDKVQKAANDGYHKGLLKAQEAEEKKEHTLMQAISSQLLQLLKSDDGQKAQQQQETQKLCSIIIEKLVPTLQKNEAKKIIETFLEENFQNFKTEKKLAIHLNPNNIKEVGEIVAKLAHQNDFEGKISIIKDETISELDCKVLWSYGGVALNQEDNKKAIQEIIKA